MAFSTEPNRTPTSIGAIRIVLDDLNGTNPGKTVTFSVEVLDASGATMAVKSGNLQPHLTAQQLSTLSEFLDDMRAKAAAEIIPS
jgi:hypothetical protein